MPVVFNPFSGTLQLTGAGSVGGVTTVLGDSGSITGTSVTIFANKATLNAGSSVSFTNSGTVSTLHLSDANNNTILGVSAGKAGITGVDNVGLGAFSLAAVQTNSSNTGIGFGSLQHNSAGTLNTAVGITSLGKSTSGLRNTCIGANAGGNIVSRGFNNTIIGYNAGFNYTTNESSNITINSLGVVAESFTVRIGDTTGVLGTNPLNAVYVQGIYSNTQNPSGTVEVVTIDNTTGKLGVTSTLGGGVTIAGDSGSIAGSSLTIFANQAALNSGSTVSFVNSSTTSTLNLSDNNSNTILGSGSGILTLFSPSNTIVGSGSFTSASVATGNVGVGAQVLVNTVSDNGLIAIGYQSMYLANGATGSTACGFLSLRSTVSDQFNSAFGYQSMLNISGAGAANNNSAFGFNTLYSSLADTDNCAFGYSSLTNTQGGSFNCAFGSQSMQGGSLSQAARNSAFGYQTLFNSSTNCNSNVAIGAQSLYNTITDSFCVAIGDGSLQSLNGAGGIVAIGYQALSSSVQDTGNTAIGFQSMFFTNGGGMGGNSNVAIGYQTMNASISGSQCLASGYQALYSATAPASIVAEGYQAMYSAVSPNACTATGYQALYSSQNDQYHCAYGDAALYSINGSNNCSAFGTDCFGALVTGQNSSGLGAFVFSGITTGEGNLGLGYNAGSNCFSNDSFNVCIASNGLAGDNGVIRIGDLTGSPAQNQFTATYICGIALNTQDPILAGPQVVTIDTNNKLGVTALLSGAVQNIQTDSGIVSGNTITLYANNIANDNGATVSFQGKTSTVIELQTTDSNGNTFVGKGSGNLANLGYYNSAFAAQSLLNITTGQGNCAFGYNSLPSITSGQYNLGLGFQALDSISSGDFNIGIGFQTGDSQNGTESSSILINALGINGVSNILQIGNGTGTGGQQLSSAYICGINGNTLGGTPLMVVIDSTTNQLGVQAIPLTTTNWTDESTAFTAVSNNGYFVTTATTATLPASPSQGDSVIIANECVGTLVVQTSGTQTIRLATGVSSAGGGLTSITTGGSVELVYRSATTEWFSISTEGSWSTF